MSEGLCADEPFTMIFAFAEEEVGKETYREEVMSSFLQLPAITWRSDFLGILFRKTGALANGYVMLMIPAFLQVVKLSLNLSKSSTSPPLGPQ